MIKSLLSIFRKVGGLFTYLLLLLLRSPVDAILCIINALFLKGVFKALAASNLNDLHHHCLTFGVANLCIYIYNGIVWCKFAAFSAKLVGRLRAYVFRSLFSMSLEKIENKGSDAWFTRLSSDLKMVLNLLTSALNIPHVILASVRFLTCSAFLYLISPPMLLIELCLLLPHLLLRQKTVIIPTENLTAMAQKKVEEMGRYLSAMAEYPDTIQLYDAGELLLQKYKKASNDMVTLRLKIGLRKAFGEFLIPLHGRGSYLLLFFLGCEMIQAKFMDFGTWTAAIQYRSAMLAASIMLLRSLLEVGKNTVGLKRMEEIYGAEYKGNT